MTDNPWVWLNFPCCNKTLAVEKPDKDGLGEYECPSCGRIVYVNTKKEVDKP